MSNQVVAALERAAKQVVHALGEGASNAEHRLLHETADNLETAAKNLEKRDGTLAKDIKTAASRHGDEHVREPTGHPSTTRRPTEESPGGSEIPTVSKRSGTAQPDARGTFRDPNNGRFAEVPGSKDHYVDRARLGDPRTREMSADSRPPFDDSITGRRQSAASKALARKNIADLSKRYGVDLSGLTSKDESTWKAALRDLRRKGASPAEVEGAQLDARTYRLSDREMHRQSERMGMQAGEEVLRQDGYRQISGSSDVPGRPNEADLIGVSPDGTSIKVVEAKGGEGGLGDGRYVHDHEPPGYAEQGSQAYLNDILKRDPGFQAELASNPALRQAYENGTLKIDYTMVSARPSGKVTETPLLVGDQS